jgi:dihydropteroate synthase
MNGRVKPQIVGVVNITPDSFSDGGLYLEPEKALSHARHLLESGADVVELGAASSNPDAAGVSPSEEIRRLGPVLARLKAEGCTLAVDSTQPEVQAYVLQQEVHYLNDIRGFPESGFYATLAASNCKLVVMHSITQGVQAERIPKNAPDVYASIRSLFQLRVEQLISAGVDRSRIILDPGMGFFLSSNPETSLAVLGKLGALRELFGLPVMISVSRKSFLRNFKKVVDCDIGSRTLAAELFAAEQGIDYIRTHDTRALAQALDTLRAINDARSLL